MPSQSPLEVDLLLTGATLVTMDPQRGILPNAAVAINGAQIAWLGTNQAAATAVHARQTYDLPGKVITPGLVNTHNHMAMTLFRGLVDDQPLEPWLETIWKVERIYTSPENVATGARLAIAEMIHSGTTCSTDMYWQYHSTTEAARQAGFRLLNGPSFTEIIGFGDKQNATRDSSIEYLDTYQGDPLIHLCVQTHAAYTTNLEMMENARQLAADRGLLFVTHASESRTELATVREMFGLSPIEVLDKAGLLGNRTLLAHCVHLTDVEIARLAETGTSVAHCISSNLKLASGTARVSDMIKAGVNVAIGTDGPASNNDLDLLHEAQLAALVQKGLTGDPTALPAEKVFEMLTIDGARALGLADRIGSVEVGKLADLTVFDFDSVNLTPCYDIYSNLVYAASPANVSDVLINGQLVMRDRKLLTIDEAEAKADVRSIADKIRLA